MSENSIKFSLSNSEQRDSWLNSGHRTLDADKYIGWDLFVQVWDKICSVPSYKADMKQFSSAHVIPWVITAFDERK